MSGTVKLLYKKKIGHCPIVHNGFVWHEVSGKTPYPA
jgi:hypothetical protein